MNLSPEEIKAAVLKECERLLPSFPLRNVQVGHGLFISRLQSSVWVFSKQSEPDFAHQDVLTISLGWPVWDHDWLIAYRLLNLEARELEERAQGLVDACEHVVLWTDSQSEQNKCREALNQWKGETK